MRIRHLSTALGILVPSALASAAFPSNDEQYFLEITNRMRLNPQAELTILANINSTTPTPTWGTPKSSESNTAFALQFFNVDAATLVSQWSTLVAAPPIAWNNNLHDAAVGHNAQMIANDLQSHQLPGEPDLGQRLTNAGYTYTTGAENVYAFAYNVFYAQAGFAIDWGDGPGGIQDPAGHRIDIMNGTYREIGIAITPENNPATQVGPLVVTQDFGRRSGNAFLTGVLYNDILTPDHFYTPGEGLGGVTINVYNAGTNTLKATATTWAAGGYSLQLANGTYDVKLTGPGLAGDITYSNVVMSSSNVKIDSETHWLPAAGGNWTTAANWNAGVPNGIGTRAFLTSYTSSASAITVNSPITVGSIDFDSTGAFAVGGSGSIKLDVAAGQARINVVGFNHSIATPLIVNDDTAINISGDLALTGGLQNPLGKTITRSGSGTLRIAGPQSHAANSNLAISSGTVRMQSDAGAAATPSTAASANLAVNLDGISAKLLLDSDQNLRDLTINYAGLGNQSIDLAGHAFNIYSPSLPTAKLSLWAAVRNAGTSPQDGIFDSTLASHTNAALGMAIEPDAHGDSRLFIRSTRTGDLNLDGTVTIADFIDLASNFGVIGTATWQEGDINADGSVSIADFIDLASNFNTSYTGQVFPISAADAQTLSSFAASIGASVPEPTTLSFLAAATLFISRRKRR